MVAWFTRHILRRNPQAEVIAPERSPRMTPMTRRPSGAIHGRPNGRKQRKRIRSIQRHSRRLNRA